ncbi:MAG: glycosyltransferase family 4 protein [Kiritimatiellae bacterium]|nr:glycosyltransferase family 4 protein [Kiritimatiellia bacterium]
MKLAVDAREWTGPVKTGIGRYLENLVTPLLAAESGLEFVFFVHEQHALPPAVAASEHEVVPLPAQRTQVVDQHVLPRLAREERVDVFFSPYYKVPLTGRFKRIITVHDIMFLRLEGVGAVKKMLTRFQARAAARKADVILVDSDFTGRDLAEAVPAARSKIRTLYPDLGAEWLKTPAPEEVAEARRRYAEDRPFLLYVGNFKPHKNVDRLVEAFSRLAAEGRAAGRCLLLAGGDDTNAPRIEARIAARHQGADIRICRNVEDAGLHALYAAADWFVTASSYEGFGYPVVEAMVSGCPVICGLNTSLTEVAGDAAFSPPNLSRSGLCDAFAEAVSMGLDERAAYIEKGRQRAAAFAPGTAAAAFCDVLGMLTS